MPSEPWDETNNMLAIQDIMLQTIKVYYIYLGVAIVKIEYGPGTVLTVSSYSLYDTLPQIENWNF